MKAFRITFFLIFFLFHFSMVCLTYDINLTWDFLINNIALLKYSALFGLVLYFTNLVLIYLDRSKYHKEINNLEQEKKAIKAQLYDLKEENSNKDQSYQSFGDTLKEQKQHKSGNEDK